MSVRLPCEAPVPIGLALVRLVAPRPASPVALGAAPARGLGTRRLIGVCRVGFGLERFVAGSVLDERAVYGKVVVRHQGFHPRLGDDRGQEAARHVAFQEAVALLAECRGVPARRVHRQPNEPAEQQVFVELLHQLTFGTDTEERLEQEVPEQPFGRDRGTPGR